MSHVFCIPCSLNTYEYAEWNNFLEECKLFWNLIAYDCEVTLLFVVKYTEKIFQIKVTDLRLMPYCELCKDGYVLEKIIG